MGNHNVKFNDRVGDVHDINIFEKKSKRENTRLPVEGSEESESSNDGESESSSDSDSSNDSDGESDESEEHNSGIQQDRTVYHLHSLPSNLRLQTVYTAGRPFVVPQTCKMYDLHDSLHSNNTKPREYFECEQQCFICKKSVISCTCTYRDMFGTVEVTFITSFPPRKDMDFTHPMTAILEARNMISDGGTIVQHYKHIDLDSIVLHMNHTLIDVSKTLYACRCKDKKMYFCSIALEAIDKLKSRIIGRYKLHKTNVHNIKMVFPQTEETFLPRVVPSPKIYSKKDKVQYESFKISNKIPLFTMNDVLFEAGYVRQKKHTSHVAVAPLTVYFKSDNTDQRGNKNKRTLRSMKQLATLVTTYQGGQAPPFAQRVFCPCAVNTLKMGRVLFSGYINTLQTYHECSEKMKQGTTTVKKLPWGTFHICDPFMEKTKTFKEEQENYQRSERCDRGKRDIRNGMKCTFDKARRDGMNEMSDSVFGEDANVHGICKWRLIFMHMTEYYAQSTIWSTKNPSGAKDVNVPRKCNIMMTRIWPLLFKLILFDIVDSEHCAFCKGKVWPASWRGMSTDDYFLKNVVVSSANMMFGGTHCNLSVEERLPKICVACIMHCIASDIKYIRSPCPRTVKT